MKKTIKGVEIEYGDEVIHTTTTIFGFWDRVKILFGRQLTIQSSIYVKEPEISCMASEATARVAPFFKPKQRGGGVELCMSSASPE